LKFVSDFLEEPVPHEHFWLTKYFGTDVRLAFLKYFLTFRGAFHFREHTGFYCSLRYLKSMKRELVHIEKAREKAKRDLDFELVAEIEMGDYKLP
jgi:hypothetical protein